MVSTDRGLEANIWLAQPFGRLTPGATYLPFWLPLNVLPACNHGGANLRLNTPANALNKRLLVSVLGFTLMVTQRHRPDGQELIVSLNRHSADETHSVGLCLQCGSGLLRIWAT